MQLVNDCSRRAPNASIMLLGAAALLAAGLACAGQGGDEFSDVWQTLVEWSQGTLGRIIAMAMVLVGLVAGVVRQSIMGLVIGVAAGMGLYNASNVIEALMTATAIDEAGARGAAAALMTLSNGLGGFGGAF